MDLDFRFTVKFFFCHSDKLHVSKLIVQIRREVSIDHGAEHFGIIDDVVIGTIWREIKPWQGINSEPETHSVLVASAPAQSVRINVWAKLVSGLLNLF